MPHRLASFTFLFLLITGILIASDVEATGKRVLVLGDSIAEGLGVARDEAFPAVLQKWLAEKGHPEAILINAGVSGSTTASGVARLRWQLQNKPDIVLIELGANDMLRGLPVEQAKKNLSDMIALARREHMKVLLAGMKVPPNYGAAYSRAFERIYPDLARQYHVPLVPFLLEGVAGHSDLNQDDGLHPTARGQQQVARNILPYLLPLL